MLGLVGRSGSRRSIRSSKDVQEKHSIIKKEMRTRPNSSKITQKTTTSKPPSPSDRHTTDTHTRTTTHRRTHARTRTHPAPPQNLINFRTALPCRKYPSAAVYMSDYADGASLSVLDRCVRSTPLSPLTGVRIPPASKADLLNYTTAPIQYRGSVARA